MPSSHSFYAGMVYYAIMRCSKRGFLYCISFSLFFTVAYAASSALPGPDGFPPFPPDQELHEEGFSASEEEFLPDPPEPPENQDKGDEEKPPAPPERAVLPPPMPPKDPDKILYYRGNRTYDEELPLKINFVRCERGEDGRIILMICFNQSVNPRSVNHDSFLIDNTTLPENIRFSFNRKGDTIRIVIPPQEQEEFCLTVQDVASFSGESLDSVEFLAKVED